LPPAVTTLSLPDALPIFSREDQRFTRDRQRGRQRRGGPRPRRFRLPSRADVIERLDRAALLPAITFIFSRQGCGDAVRQCVTSGDRKSTRLNSSHVSISY